MPLSKRIADFLTLSRYFLAMIIVWYGFWRTPDTLTYVVFVLTLCWLTDVFDGFFARRSGGEFHTLVGDNDLLADLIVTTALLIYMTLVGLLHWIFSIIVVVAFLLLFWWFGYNLTVGNAWQGCIYIAFLFFSLAIPPHAGFILIVYLVLVIVITWPRIPKQVIPAFLNGIRELYDQVVGPNQRFT